MNTSSQFERDESVFDVFVFWWLILSLLFFVELFGATAISQGLPVPLGYIFIGLLVVFAIALIPALLHGMVVPRVNEELIVSTSALLSILVLFTQLYSVGHFYYLGPYLVVSTLVIIPFLVHWLLRPDNTTGFWIGLPFLFLASGLFLYRTLFDYWGIFSLRDPPLLSLIILFLVAAVVLTVLSMDRFRIRRFIQSHRSAVITSIAE